MVPERSSDPRDDTSSALLTEIEPAVAPAAPTSEDGSSPSSKGSYVHVESEPVVVIEETVVVVVADEEEAEEDDEEEEVENAEDPVEASL